MTSTFTDSSRDPNYLGSKMQDNLNQSTSEKSIPEVTLETMGVNMKAYYQEKESTFMGRKGKAHANYQDGENKVQLTFRKQDGHIMITKVIKPPFRTQIVTREKVIFH